MSSGEFENQKKIESYELELQSKVCVFGTKIIGLKNIAEFYKKELDFWQAIKVSSNIVNYYIQYISDISSKTTNLLNAFNNYNAQQIENSWNDIRNNALRQSPNNASNILYIYSLSPEAVFLKNLYDKESEQAEGAHEYFLNKQVNLGNNKNKFKGYLRGFMFELQDDSEILTRKDFEKQTFAKFSKELLKDTNRFKSDFDNLKTNMNEWSQQQKEAHDQWETDKKKNMESFLEDKNNKLTELENTYTKKLQLEGPVRYWRYRIKKYKSQGITWLILLGASTFIISGALFYILYNFPSAFHKNIFKGEPEAIKGIIILASLLSFFAYLIKTFSKLTFSSFHLQRDAEEREQLTMVYLSLEKDGKVSKEEKQLILQSLFSRTDSGLLSGDNSPIMPGSNALLEKILRN